MICARRKLSKQIIACCVLHNFIETREHRCEGIQDPPGQTQRDGVQERQGFSAHGRRRIMNRWHMLRLMRRNGVTVPEQPRRNFPGTQIPMDLAAGKAVRELLKEYCWQLHCQRNEDRIALHAEAFARANDDRDYFDTPDEDPDALHDPSWAPPRRGRRTGGRRGN